MRCAEHGKVLPHYRCEESERWLDDQAARTTGSKPHEPLCFDKVGHPHDNECECWCHDEGDLASAPYPRTLPSEGDQR